MYPFSRKQSVTKKQTKDTRKHNPQHYTYSRVSVAGRKETHISFLLYEPLFFPTQRFVCLLLQPRGLEWH